MGQENNLTGTSIAAGIMSIQKKSSHIDYRPKGLEGFVLIYTIDGAGLTGVSNRRKLLPGDLLLLQPDKPHYYKADRRALWKHQWIYFQPKTTINNLLNWPKEKDDFAILQIDAENDISIRKWIQDMIDILKTNNPYKQQIAYNNLHNILLSVDTFNPQSSFHLPDRRIAHAINYIKKNIHSRNLSIEKSADEACLSLSRFAHLFSEMTGKPPGRFIEEERFKKASELLIFTSYDIQTIASMCGFSGSQYFIRVFRKNSGISPGNYRKQSRRIE